MARSIVRSGLWRRPDQEGLVVRYEGGWERVGSSSGQEPTRVTSR